MPNLRMFRKRTAVLLAALLVVPAAAQVPSPPAPSSIPVPATGKVTGRILRSDGKTPIAGAVVRATHLRNDAPVASEPTGPDGGFELPPIPYGYLDIAVETPEGTFLANEVVNVPPDGKVSLTFSLTRFEQLPQAWWAGRERRDLPGGAAAVGIAELSRKARGRDFWKGPKGVAVLAGAGAIALAAIASGGGSEDVSPSNP